MLTGLLYGLNAIKITGKINARYKLLNLRAMGIWMNKSDYKKLISEDLERIDKEMAQSPERDHIKAVLKWSIDVIYDGVEAIHTNGNSVLPIQRVSGSGSNNSLEKLGSSKSDAFKKRHYR